MIPLRDENPTRSTAYVVYGLVALNIVVFLYNGALRYDGGNPLSGFVLVPAELTTGRDFGAPTPVSPWVTIFTSMFMHANLVHIGGNLLYLWIFGNNIEDVLGHFRFLLFYLACGVGAAVAQVFTDPGSTVPMVGASGAIAGVLGAYLYLFPRARIISLVLLFPFIQAVALPASVVLGLWIVLQVISSLLIRSEGGGVAYFAHVGGFVSGLLLVLIVGGRRLLRGRRPVEYYRSRRW